MHSITVLALVALASATKHLEARSMTSDLLTRQIIWIPCKSVPADSPNFCEASCGAGSQQCGSDRTVCFSPTKGQVCCKDGCKCLLQLSQVISRFLMPSTAHCDAGERCTTTGCCKDDGNGGCEGVTFIETLAGQGYSSTVASSASAPPTTVSSSSISAPPAYSSASSSSSVSVPPVAYTPPASATGGNATMPTWYPPAQQTTNAGVKGEVAGWLVGGFAILGVGYFV